MNSAYNWETDKIPLDIIPLQFKFLFNTPTAYRYVLSDAVD